MGKIASSFVEEALGRAQRRESRLSPAALSVPGMICEFNRHLYNNLCAQGAYYLEVGTLMGASVVAAAYGNTGRFWAVDNFSQWPLVDNSGAFMHLRGNPLYHQAVGKTTRQAWLNHVSGLGLQERIALVEADCLAFVPDFQVDVFYYDGDHSARTTEQALRHFLPLLRPSILLIDDWDHPEVRLGAERARLPLARTWHCQPAWNGLLIAILEEETALT